MGKFIDLTGQKFERLTVIKRVEDYISPNGMNRVQWLCKCDCEDDKYIIIKSSSLVSGKTKSCGCYKRELFITRTKKLNKYDLTGDYGIGFTSKGEEFYFDLEDYDKIKIYHWYKTNHKYISHKSNDLSIYLHRLIMNASKDEMIDHINFNKSDNRKNNLRICNVTENNRNTKKYKNNQSGYKGVYRNNNKWVANIRVDKKTIYLGRFDNIEDAIKVRNDAEVKFFGEFSCIEDDYVGNSSLQ